MAATPISKAQFASAVKPMLGKWLGTGYNYHPDFTAEMFEKRKAKSGTVDDHMYMDLPKMQLISEGEKTPYAATSERYRVDHVIRDLRLGVIITQNMIEDGINLDIVQRLVTGLGKSAIETKNTLAASVLNNGFSTSYPGGDGAALISASHPTPNGNVSNLTGTATLSEAALEDMANDTEAMAADNGFECGARLKALIVPRALRFDAHRILNSMKRVGTADNDPNALRDMNVFPRLIVNPFLTSSTRYFGLTDVDDGLVFYSRKELMTSRDVEFDSDNVKIKAHERYIHSWGDFRGVVGVNAS